MLKLSINKENSSAYIINCSSFLWDCHLAYLNFRSSKYISKHGLISYDDKLKINVTSAYKKN